MCNEIDKNWQLSCKVGLALDYPGHILQRPGKYQMFDRYIGNLYA